MSSKPFHRPAETRDSLSDDSGDGDGDVDAMDIATIMVAAARQVNDAPSDSDSDDADDENNSETAPSDMDSVTSEPTWGMSRTRNRNSARRTKNSRVYMPPPSMTKTTPRIRLGDSYQASIPMLNSRGPMTLTHGASLPATATAADAADASSVSSTTVSPAAHVRAPRPANSFVDVLRARRTRAFAQFARATAVAAKSATGVTLSSAGDTYGEEDADTDQAVSNTHREHSMWMSNRHSEPRVGPSFQAVVGSTTDAKATTTVAEPIAAQIQSDRPRMLSPHASASMLVSSTVAASAVREVKSYPNFPDTISDMDKDSDDEDNDTETHSWRIPCANVMSLPNVQAVLRVTMKDYPVHLRTSFGTSHSQTSSRRNVMLRLALRIRQNGTTVADATGYGEVALPPKKRGCYEADVSDVRNFFRSYCASLQRHSDQFAVIRAVFPNSSACNAQHDHQPVCPKPQAAHTTSSSQSSTAKRGYKRTHTTSDTLSRSDAIPGAALARSGNPNAQHSSHDREKRVRMSISSSTTLPMAAGTADHDGGQFDDISQTAPTHFTPAYDPFAKLNTQPPMFKPLRPDPVTSMRCGQKLLESANTAQGLILSSTDNTVVKHELIDCIMRFSFWCLDTCYDRDRRARCRAGLSGIEMALLDLWGHVRTQPLYRLMYSNWPQVEDVQSSAMRTDTSHNASDVSTSDSSLTQQAVSIPLHRHTLRSFGTVSLDPDLNKMTDSCRFILEHTPLLKIKLDSDLKRSETILAALDKVCNESSYAQQDIVWTIDANAAWSADLAEQFVPVLEPYSSRIFMVEQPFPLFKTVRSKLVRIHSNADAVHDSTVDAAELQHWERVKNIYELHGMWIYADESVSTQNDLERLQRIVHGCNIKLEKAGGIRAGIEAIAQARRLGMQVWIGIMVASSLGCTASAHLLPLADGGWGDVDGPLLVTQESDRFLEGVCFVGAGKLRLDTSRSGLGIRTKD
jgi:L-alanine-DL-glutamate epimerase-like enolase superfamily enzyme